jgi:hypothetical protein
MEEFIKTVREMREQQKGFFAAKYGTMSRTDYFNAAKALEKKVDKMLLKFESGQKDLFE